MKRRKPGLLALSAENGEGGDLRLFSSVASAPSAGCKPSTRLTPVECRRLAARQELQEVSEIARLLMQGDDEPLEPVLAIDKAVVARTQSDLKALQKYKSVIMRKTASVSECENALMKLSSTICHESLDLLLTESINKIGSKKKKKGKSGKSSASAPKSGQKKAAAETTPLDDPITRETPLLLHLASSVGNVAAFESILYSVDSESAQWANAADGHNVLHLAVKSNNLNMVRSICERVPQCCRYRDLEGKLPLHLALQTMKDPLLTSTLLARYPRGITVADRRGFFPIHTAASNAFLPGVRALLAVDPHCVHTTCSGGDVKDPLYPIDLAAEFYGSVAKELEQCSTKDPTLVERKHLCEETVEVILMTALHRRAVFLPRDETAPFLPLHAALVMNMKVGTWHTLFDIYSSLHADDIDEHGYNLLHVAAMKAASSTWPPSALRDLVQDIHSKSPNAVKRKNSQGLTPFQVGVTFGAAPAFMGALVECGGGDSAVCGAT